MKGVSQRLYVIRMSFPPSFSPLCNNFSLIGRSSESNINEIVNPRYVCSLDSVLQFFLQKSSVTVEPRHKPRRVTLTKRNDGINKDRYRFRQCLMLLQGATCPVSLRHNPCLRPVFLLCRRRDHPRWQTGSSVTRVPFTESRGLPSVRGTVTPDLWNSSQCSLRGYRLREPFVVKVFKRFVGFSMYVLSAQEYLKNKTTPFLDWK